MKIQTPLGYVDVQIDDVSVEYDSVELAPDKRWPVDGVYRIFVSNPRDGRGHTIACKIKAPVSADISYSSGEELETVRFRDGAVQVDIGIVVEESYKVDHLDYDSAFPMGGIAYKIMPETKTERFVFGVAWLNCRHDKNEGYTWFSCDPTMM